jgi:uncharacterized protein YacL
VIPSKLRDWITGTPTGITGPSSWVLLWLVRFVFVVMSIGIGISMFFFVDNQNRSVDNPAALSKATLIGVAAFLAVMVVPAIVIWADVRTRNKQITTISAVFFGLLIGFLLSTLFWQALQPIISEYLSRESQAERLVHLFITLVTCYLAVSLLLQTKDDFRFLIPYVEFSKQLKGAKPLVLDTSVIIDGRIADICDTGIIDSKLVVPRFVLQELQGIADSSDKIKRNRGRRGLDILKKMQSNPRVEVQLHEGNLAELREVHKVDERLVVLAKSLSGRVVTNDFNLNKICQVQNVEVINLNELSNALKLMALPGEILTIKIVKQGDQHGQGVGYLEDGTMVVVGEGRGHIGQEVAVIVTSVLQNPAGRMIFARIDNNPTPLPPPRAPQAAGSPRYSPPPVAGGGDGRGEGG